MTADALAAVVEDAPAKINLHLHLTGRRDDGYHLLDSLVVFAPFGDRLRVRPARTLSLAIDGPFAGALAGEDPDSNLVLRAARSLAAASGIGTGAALALGKNLPVASGIGGGSSDAAAALRALARLWRIDPRLADRLALDLGADVPVCLRARPTRMQGIGEILTEAPPLPPLHLVLVNPGVPVSTGAVFRAAREAGFRPPAVLPPGWEDATALAATLAGLSNDLEAPAIALAPAIAAVLEALRATPGCLLARMSGSGATCFGLYATAPEAHAAAAALSPRARSERWWIGADAHDPVAR